MFSILAIVGLFSIGLSVSVTSVDAATRSYGNGVYCNDEKCWVNQNEATENIAGIMISGWASGLAGVGK